MYEMYKCNLKKENWNLNSKYTAIKSVLLVSFICWFTSGMFVLRSNYCGRKDTNNLFEPKYCEMLEGTGYDRYDNSYVFYHNFWEWTIFYYIGLNFTLLDYIPGSNKFTLSADSIKEWPWYCWVGLVVLVVSLVSLIIYIL